jgi:kynurenine formamidase
VAVEIEALDRRLSDLAARRPAGSDPDRWGTVSLADGIAALRGLATVAAGRSISLARPIVAGTGDRDPRVEPWVENFGRVDVGYDRVSAYCHGLASTHLDGLAHVGWDGGWYDGVSVDQIPSPTSIETWATTGIVTRGIYVDAPAGRGTDWIPGGEPVSADEISTALSNAGIVPERGDALLLDCGRDRFEADHPGSPLHPVVAPDVAEWIVDTEVSVICWDFLDAPVEPRSLLTVHRLIWAIGLASVDNCDFRALRGALSSAGVCLLVVAPLPIAGATGSLVNPIAVV